jgi:ferritin
MEKKKSAQAINMTIYTELYQWLIYLSLCHYLCNERFGIISNYNHLKLQAN